MLLRVCLGIAAVLMATLALAAAVTTAESPPGPRLAVIATSPHFDIGTELRTIGPAGEGSRKLAGDSPDYRTGVGASRPSWSSDGHLVAFSGFVGEYSPVLWVVGCDGGRKRLLPNTGTISDPVFMPNGEEIAFTKLVVVSGQFERPASEEPLRVKVAVWAIDVDSGSQRRLTTWSRFPKFEPTSFSPDGRLLAGTEATLDGKIRAVAIDLRGGGRTVLAPDAEEPVYSADGTRVAFVREKTVAPRRSVGLPTTISGDLYVATADGAVPVRIAHHRGRIDSPSWDPSGERLAFVRSGPRTPFGESALVELNADGSCPTTVLSSPERGGIHGVAWQPGPGREAGPIAC
jgi:Tol biopolymer transport system component